MRTAALLVVLAVGISHALADGWELSGAARQLQQSSVTGTAVFPYHSCTKRASSGSPCYFGFPTSRAINSTVSEFCFTAQCPGCSGGSNTCCSLLTANIHKIVFNIRYGCRPALKSFFQPVSYNGAPIASDLYIDDVNNNSTMIRWSNVDITSSDLNGDRICIKAASPCNSISSLFVTNSDGFPMVALLDSTDGGSGCCPSRYPDLPPPPPPPSPPPPSPPPPCTHFCFTWHRTNGPADTAACDLLASQLTAMNTQYGSYKLLGSGFTCSAVDATARNVTACADFAAEADATAFGNMFGSGDAKTSGVSGFELLSVSLGWTTTYTQGSNGQPVCDQAGFYVVLTTKLTGVQCQSWSYTQGCAPVQTNEFPFCVCDPGVPRKTPYAIQYKRTYSKSGSNYYCFQIRVNQTQCKGSRCCSMDLDKIEWLSDGTNCLSAVNGFTVSTNPGVVKAPVWTRATDNSFTPAQTFGVFKTNNLALNLANADGAEVCILLKSSGSCPKLENFCYQGSTMGCQYAIFDLSAGCCAEDFSMSQYGTFSRRRFQRL
ncbi:hypothetical protein Agub_g7884 [Astrephomene gubernaculifera]|uniref:Pherophorin domain-containing protein n=1 Tax=Astrephomene gubernaculifera TaxID=47775 RepID=A0AAD3DQR0_9CHLO|nr:hypothetical protein Agub_g7884 [Astrephomene gubernaculifera]